MSGLLHLWYTHLELYSPIGSSLLVVGGVLSRAISSKGAFAFSPAATGLSLLGVFTSLGSQVPGNRSPDVPDEGDIEVVGEGDSDAPDT